MGFPGMNRKQRRASKADAKPPPGADPIALHDEGIEAFRRGNLDLAADRIIRAIAADGQVPNFHYNLAIVLRAQNRLADAALCYQRAIALKPGYADAHNNLGNVLKLLGQPDQARASFERALQLRPGNADSHYNLGILYSEAGDRDQAAEHFRRCLENDPEDSRGAGLLLAHLGLGAAPDRTPPAQLQKIYDVRSGFWDRETSYFGDALVADALRRHAPQAKMDILDIGCGTGLAGARVRDLAARLNGVDLSSAMLEKARAKNIYDRLEQADLLTFLSAHPGGYDALLGAATLIHFGELLTVFQAAAASLRAQGLFVFTLFAGDEDFAVAASGKLAQSGCYRHSAGYVERLAETCGFSIMELQQVVHEQDEAGNPVAGLLAVLRRTAA